MPKANRYLEALKESFNVVGLAGAASLSLALLNPVPLLAGVVAEACYLMFVPDSRWYEARLSKRYDAEVERRRQQIKDQVLPTLRPEMQARFARLETMRQQISAQSVEDEKWFREVLRKLDYLLEKFLLFAAKEREFRAYVTSVVQELRGDSRPAQTAGGDPGFVVRDKRAEKRIPIQFADNTPKPQPQPQPEAPAGSMDPWVRNMIGQIESAYDGEIEQVKGGIEAEQDDDTKAVLQKRLDVLQRRREFITKIGKILTNLDHQLELLEDTFGLINDEIRARSPEQVLSDIDDVVWQTDSMTQVLEEMAPYEQMVARLSA